MLANNPDYRLVIEAYTDGRGDQEVLRKLTQDRADALAAQLASAGVDNARIQATGMGSASPVAPNTTVSSRARNRRIELVLTPIAGQVSSTTN
ncbi:MAG: OmpA family protein [Pyrinomonadaceae bacterium]